MREEKTDSEKRQEKTNSKKTRKDKFRKKGNLQNLSKKRVVKFIQYRANVRQEKTNSEKNTVYKFCLKIMANKQDNNFGSSLNIWEKPTVF